MTSRESGRRRFLKDGTALAGLALGTGTIRPANAQTPGSEIPAASPDDARAYGQRSQFETSGRSSKGGTLTPLQDTLGIITPSALHYVISHGNIDSALRIDPRQHRLMIHGLVDRPLIFTLEELKRLPSVSRIHYIECASNTAVLRTRGLETVQDRHGRTSCSEWTGIPLSRLLREAGLQPGASWIVAQGAEAATLAISIPLEKAMKDCLVAYGQNGEAVRPENGYPMRLLTPGFEGINNVKWLRRIKVVNEPQMTYNETAAHTSLRPDGKARWYMFELGPKSVITRPSGGQRLPGTGFYEITGLAWSGSGTVRRVEISTDGGRTWKDAQLQEPVLRIAHTRFHFPWTWNGEEVVLQSRCTDDTGTVQPTIADFARIYNVDLDFFRVTTSSVNRVNAIQPWKVARDGKVYNAMGI